MRFVTAAYMTGFPAISSPMGYVQSGLPIRMQAIVRAWKKSLLLRLAVDAEEVVMRKEMNIHFQIL